MPLVAVVCGVALVASMSVAGIDYSSRAVDIVLLDEDTDKAEWHRFPLAGEGAFDRARDVSLRTPGRADTFWDEIMAVGIEQPRGHHASVALGRIQGAILSCIPAWLLVQPWNPAEWRKAVGLPGNASKEQIRLHAAFRLGPRPDYDGPLWPQDACDAYCIALATRAAIQVTA